GRGQRHDAEDPRAAALRDRADRAALAGGVAPLEDDNDPLTGRLDPVLHQAELGLEPEQLLLIIFARQLCRPCRPLATGFLGVLRYHMPPTYQLRKNPTSPSLPSG